LSSPWWSVPQAIVWIVKRSESQLLRADGVRTLAGVERMKGIRPASSLDEPPLSLAAASNELLHAWRARRITLVGRKWGLEPSRSIAARSDLRLRDYRGEVCLGNKTLYFDTNPFWSNLSVRADDCKRCWPAPSVERKPGFRAVTVANCPSDSEVLAFMEEKQHALRAERKRAGRDVLLRAAMNHFSLSRKITKPGLNQTAERIAAVMSPGHLSYLRKIRGPREFLKHVNWMAGNTMANFRIDLALTHYMVGNVAECIKIFESIPLEACLLSCTITSFPSPRS
jgi:hypothetical protein